MEPPPDCSSRYAQDDEFMITKTNSVRRKDSLESNENGEFLDLTKKREAFEPQKMGDLQFTSSQSSMNSEEGSSVRSSAIIAYSASKNNTWFSRLAPHTDLNLAPSNWLRKTVGLRPEVVLPGGKYTANQNQSFSGFSMARSHLDCVGKVDVVSDAENIKKLLMMPYSKAHVSMAIHRIGRTLLLENFDIKKHSAEESEWQWFRNFYQELVQQQGSNKFFKKKSASSQYERLMLSKFLYYSIRKDSFNKLTDKPENREFSPRGDGDGIQIDEQEEAERLNGKFYKLTNDLCPIYYCCYVRRQCSMVIKIYISVYLFLFLMKRFK